MLWFLLIVTLSLGGQGVAPHITDSRIQGTFYSEQECIKKMQEFFKEAKEDKIPIPPEINMGCVPYNKLGV